MAMTGCETTASARALPASPTVAVDDRPTPVASSIAGTASVQSALRPALTPVYSQSRFAGGYVNGVRSRYADPCDVDAEFGIKMQVVGDATIVFSDLVESVRLFERHGLEAATIWDGILNSLDDPAPGGATVRRVSGDGVVLSAPTPDGALDAAVALHAALGRARLGLDGVAMQVRTGIASGEIFLGTRDVYGAAINVAARLAAEALPGEILLTEPVRLRLSAVFDRRLEDRGELRLRNVAEPVHTHALRPASGPPSPLLISDASLKPLVAVLPFTQEGGNADAYPIGEAFADAIVTELSTVRGFAVISGLSARRLAPATGVSPIDAVRDHLGAHYVVWGRCSAVEGGRIKARVELCDVRTGVALWTERIRGTVAEMLDGEGPTLTVVERLVRAVLDSEHERARSRPLAAVENYTLLVSGVALMHGLNPAAFERAGVLLEELAGRASRQSTPLAWLAKWHVLRALQGLTPDRAAAADAALALTRRAVDAEPENALAHAVQGFAWTNLRHRFDEGGACFDLALAANPSEPLGWLLRAAQRSFTGDGTGAVADAREALRLSPVDPHRYFHLALAAGAYLAAGDNDRALALASESLRINRRHLSTLRIKAVAEQRLGRSTTARATVQELLRLDPGMTITGYLAQSPAAAFPIGRAIADALQEAGVPA